MSPGSHCWKVLALTRLCLHRGDTVRPDAGTRQETKTRGADAPAERITPLAHLPEREPSATVHPPAWERRRRPGVEQGLGPGLCRHKQRPRLYAARRGSSGRGRPRAEPACHLQDRPPTRPPSAGGPQREPPPPGWASLHIGLTAVPASRPASRRCTSARRPVPAGRAG